MTPEMLNQDPLIDFFLRPVVKQDPLICPGSPTGDDKASPCHSGGEANFFFRQLLTLKFANVYLLVCLLRREELMLHKGR